MKRLYISSSLYYQVYQHNGRTIYAPSEDLKEKQKIILNFIKLVYKLSLNTKKAAMIHCAKKWVLKTDIKSFYKSFSKEQIQTAIHEICEKLIVEYKTEISEKDIYKYCTINEKLPTGALTSAHLANIAFETIKIDEEIYNFCKELNVKYSRYMDDMTFSANNKLNLQKTESFVQKLLEQNGFSLNKEKTKYISDNKRQEVLGILVNNKKTAISRINKNTIRSIIFYYLKSVYLEKRLGINVLFVKKTNLSVIAGYMSYIKNSDLKYYTKIKEYIANKIKKFNIDNFDEIILLKKALKIQENDFGC